MRNAKRAMAWLQSNPPFDEIIEKIVGIEVHIEKHGTAHPLHSDFKNALFLLRQEELRLKQSDAHLQLGMDFGDFDISPLGSQEPIQVQPHTSKLGRDAVFRSLRKKLSSLP